jgi:hypothetical protein
VIILVEVVQLIIQEAEALQHWQLLVATEAMVTKTN